MLETKAKLGAQPPAYPSAYSEAKDHAGQGSAK